MKDSNEQEKKPSSGFLLSVTDVANRITQIIADRGALCEDVIPDEDSEVFTLILILPGSEMMY